MEAAEAALRDSRAVGLPDLALSGSLGVGSLEDSPSAALSALSTEGGLPRYSVGLNLSVPLGGILFGIIGDKKGRLSVLFGSILLYSIANILNGMVTTVPQYLVLRFIAGVGLAGELTPCRALAQITGPPP